MIVLFLRVTIWIFASVVVIGAAAFLVIEAMDKVESIQKRAPWIPRLLERRDAFVPLLLICVVLLVGVGYELLTKEMPEVAPLPPIVFKPPASPNVNIQKVIIKTTGSGRLDRDMNDQQSNHLYDQLKVLADNKNTPPGFADITVILPYPQDRESNHLFGRLNKVFTDAHWKVTPYRGWPMPGLTGRIQNEMPIGIWMMTTNQYLQYEMWSDLQQAGLDSQERRQDLPPDFKGTILVIGYKDAPF